MSDFELELVRRFRSSTPLPDSETAERIFRLATAAPSRARHAKPFWRTNIALATMVLSLVAAGAAGAIVEHYLGSAPGMSAGFSSFERLAAASRPSSIPLTAFEHSAEYLGLSTEEAAKRLRLLQTGLDLGPGATRGEGALYVLLGDNGAACAWLTGQGGACIDQNHAPAFPGVLPQILPGYPGETPALVAVVADNVTELELLTVGQREPLAIINNSVYANLPGFQFGEPLSLKATYSDGTTHVFILSRPARPRAR